MVDADAVDDDDGDADEADNVGDDVVIIERIVFNGELAA